MIPAHKLIISFQNKKPKENIKIFSDGDVIEIDNFKSFKSHKKVLNQISFLSRTKVMKIQLMIF